MNTKNTFMLAGIAGISLVLAVLFIVVFGMPGTDLTAKISIEELELGPKPNEIMFPKLSKKINLKSIEIIKYDVDSQELHHFTLVKTKHGSVSKDSKAEDAWSILVDAPGEAEGKYYPADNMEAVSKLTTAFVDLKYNKRVALDVTGHRTLGVIDPEDKEAGATTSRGSRIIFTTDTDEVVVDAIIGKKDKKNENFTYIRKTGNNYTFAIPLAADIDTSFSKWVDEDLLRLESNDITAVKVDPYSVKDALLQVRLEDQGKGYAFSKEGADWKSQTPAPAGKEINTGKISQLVTALDGLKLTGVRSLSQRSNIRQMGFYTDQEGNLFSQKGTLEVYTNKGITYKLFVGGSEVGSGNSLATGQKEGADATEDSAKDPSANPAEAESKPGEEGADPKDPSKKKGAAGGDHRYVLVRTFYDATKDLTVDDEKKDDAKKEDGKPEDQAADKATEESSTPTVSEGETLSKRLNTRFEPWFYLISDADFKKIHKTFDEYIKEVTAAPKKDK